ncbi:GDP-L-fucose synthase [subsurface metagenome]
MKVAVAGGLGFLGSNIVMELKKRGHEPLPFSRRTGVDIRSFDQINEFLVQNKPDRVVNCAAHVGGIAYNALAPIEVYEDNLLIGFNLVRACYQNGVKKLVNIMPNCTYPGVAEVYTEDEWWQGEMHETVLTYGMPRKAVWVQCWAYQQKHGFNSIHLVLPNLYGPGDHFDPIRSHALGALIKKIVEAKVKNSPTVEIWGTGNPVREWGYVKDAAEGIVIAVEKYDDIAILNLGEGKGYPIKETAEMIREAVSWEGEFVFDTNRPDGAPRKILDVKKMKKLLGWQPETRIRDGIRKTVEWYMQNELQKEGSGR